MNGISLAAELSAALLRLLSFGDARERGENGFANGASFNGHAVSALPRTGDEG